MSANRWWGPVTAVVAVVVVLGSVLTGAAVAGGGDDGPTAVAQRPTIVMEGSGSAVGVPDQLLFTAGISVTRTDVAPAMDEASRTMARVLAALAPYDVRKSDVQTVGLNVTPVYDYSGGQERLTGYRVSQRARVLVRDLRKAGRALAAAATVGGNAVRLHGIRLDIADRAGLLARARKAAVADARTKAQEYAEAGGQALGTVLSLREVRTSATSPRPQALAAFDTAALRGTAPVPVRAGKQDLGVRIRVVWALAEDR